MMKTLLTWFCITVALVAPLLGGASSPSVGPAAGDCSGEGPELRSPSVVLDGAELAAVTGRGCTEAIGLGVGFAFGAGYTVAIPPVSATLLTASLVMGLSVALFC